MQAKQRLWKGILSYRHKTQAIEMAVRRTKFEEKGSPIVQVYEFDEGILASKDLKESHYAPSFAIAAQSRGLYAAIALPLRRGRVAFAAQSTVALSTNPYPPEFTRIYVSAFSGLSWIKSGTLLGLPRQHVLLGLAGLDKAAARGKWQDERDRTLMMDGGNVW